MVVSTGILTLQGNWQIANSQFDGRLHFARRFANCEFLFSEFANYFANANWHLAIMF